jgi:hypothetical protein
LPEHASSTSTSTQLLLLLPQPQLFLQLLEVWPLFLLVLPENAPVILQCAPLLLPLPPPCLLLLVLSPHKLPHMLLDVGLPATQQPLQPQFLHLPFSCLMLW